MTEIERILDQMDRQQRPNTDTSWYALLHGILHHTRYHSGWLAMLKQAMAA